MKRLLLSFAFIVGFPTASYAQQPAPCGPAAELGAQYSANVAEDSRCFEIRMYTAEPMKDGVGGIDNLHQRFREKEIEIFERLGAEIIAVWQRLDDPNTLVWMLAYKNRAHRQEVWDAFLKDDEWVALLAKYPVPISAEAFTMSATDYSKLK